MPDRYQGHRLPAIVYAQPFEFGVAGILLLSGVVLGLQPDFVPASVKVLGWPWSVLFRVLMISAGLFMFAGLFRGRNRWSHTAEMSGMVMGATVFGTYAAGLLTTGNPAALLGFFTNLIIAVSCGIKARALFIEAHDRLLLLRSLPLPDHTDDGGS